MKTTIGKIRKLLYEAFVGHDIKGLAQQALQAAKLPLRANRWTLQGKFDVTVLQDALREQGRDDEADALLDGLYGVNLTRRLAGLPMEIAWTQVDGRKVIDVDALESFAPYVVDESSGEELENLWIMTDVPTIESEDEDGYATWSGTNEPELGEMVSEGWNDLAIDLGEGRAVVLLSGNDDEYGSVWDDSSRTWNSYMF